MTGYEVTRQALMLLDYTAPGGDIDPRQNGEQLRRALPVLNTVLADIRHVQGQPFHPLDSLMDLLELEDDLAMRVAVPGVAMYLALGEDDGDGYNRFAAEYVQKRSGIPRGNRRIVDVLP